MKTAALSAMAAFGMAIAVPAAAQDTAGQTGGANSSSMSSMPGGSMGKSQMAMMKRCQAMTQDAMMKNKKCAAMAQAHPGMMQMQSGSTPATSGSDNQ